MCVAEATSLISCALLHVCCRYDGAVGWLAKFLMSTTVVPQKMQPCDALIFLAILNARIEKRDTIYRVWTKNVATRPK